jgi:predicted ArsR family transcriptional regulator
LQQISQHLPQNGINVILEDVADRMAGDANIPNLPPNERLNLVVDYLNQHGYNAGWEATTEGFVLFTTNCPYHHIAETNTALCEMDMRLVTSLMGVVPRLLSRVSAGGDSCSYLIPYKAN